MNSIAFDVENEKRFSSRIQNFFREIAKSVGQRIPYYRTQRGLSQEKLAELSGCYPTYIGQQEHVYRILLELDAYKNGV